jgi:hypothetical protein
MALDVDPANARLVGLPTVQGELLYVEPPTEPLYSYTYPPPEGRPWLNARNTPHLVPIRNARPIAEQLSLDIEGFELVRHRTSVRDFYDEAQASGPGHAEAADIVARATGAARVVVFDHTIRARAPGEPDRRPGTPARQPATRVHDDYTEASAPQRVRDVMGEQAEALLSKRYAFINVWRPIRHAAVDWPLTLCDARSSAPEDFQATALIYPDRTGEVYAATFSPAHRWFYFPAMELDETVLIKCYDSRKDVARFVLHTAFADPNTPPGAPLRESIEFRTIAFFD